MHSIEILQIQQKHHNCHHQGQNKLELCSIPSCRRCGRQSIRQRTLLPIEVHPCRESVPLGNIDPWCLLLRKRYNRLLLPGHSELRSRARILTVNLGHEIVQPRQPAEEDCLLELRQLRPIERIHILIAIISLWYTDCGEPVLERVVPPVEESDPRSPTC